MNPATDKALVSLAKFAVYLLARQEALEAILLQKNAATKQELLLAFGQAEASMGRFGEIAYRDEKSFESELITLLRMLRSRLQDRLR